MNKPRKDREFDREGKKRESSRDPKSARGGRSTSNPKPLSPPRNLRSSASNKDKAGPAAASGREKPATRPARGEKDLKNSRQKPSSDRTSKSAKGTAPGGKEKKPGSVFEYRPKSKNRILKPGKPKATESEGIRLNKYIANAGICSRREADELIKAGVVEINGEVVTEMGIRVKPGDEVKFEGQRLKTERNVYVLLNKPKDYITTLKDPHDRRTVMALVKNAAKERIYPVGRLDRNTTGVLLFTNDGELSTKLTHPRHGFKKIYHVHLDSNVKKEHLAALLEGIELEDGFAKADAVEYVADAKDKSQVGIEIHIGRNRIVRRMFEHFGYKIKKLDRVYFAGLTKKDLPRGKWRLLTEQEVNMLKMLR